MTGVRITCGRVYVSYLFSSVFCVRFSCFYGQLPLNFLLIQRHRHQRKILASIATASHHRHYQQPHDTTTPYTSTYPRVALPDAVGFGVLDHELDHLYSWFLQTVQLLPGGGGVGQQ